jgi:hypothetical protein
MIVSYAQTPEYNIRDLRTSQRLRRKNAEGKEVRNRSHDPC